MADPRAPRGDGAAPGPRTVEAVLILLAGVVVGLAGATRSLLPFDEALPLIGGERTLLGELPFRDFYGLYPPGQFFTLAGLFAVFGVKAIVIRTYCIVVRALIAYLLYRLASRAAGRRLGAVCWAAAIMWLTSVQFYGYPVLPALCLALAGLWALLGCVGGPGGEGAPRGRRLAAAGAAMGLAALFRLDIGAWGLVASVPVFAGIAAAAPSRSAWMRSVGIYVATAALTFGIPAAWLLTKVPFAEVVFELFTYPSTVYATTRGLPIPPILTGFPADRVIGPLRSLFPVDALAFRVPVIIDAIALIRFAWKVRRDRRTLLDAGEATLGCAALFSGLMLGAASVRPDNVHALAMVITHFVPAAGLFGALLDAGTRRARVAAAVLAFASALTLLPAGLHLPRPSLHHLRRAFFGDTEPGRERASNLAADPGLDPVAAYVRSVVPAGGRIFVGCGRHDRILMNEAIIYVLAGRLPGTRYHQLDPGVATTVRVQRAIVADLERYRVEWLVIATRFDDIGEPNGSSVSSGVVILDDYIGANYRLDRAFGPTYFVMRRHTAWR